jgi:hypothetical protein
MNIAIREFRDYLNFIMGLIPDEIHNELWNKFMRLTLEIEKNNIPFNDTNVPFNEL